MIRAKQSPRNEQGHLYWYEYNTFDLVFNFTPTKNGGHYTPLPEDKIVVTLSKQWRGTVVHSWTFTKLQDYVFILKMDASTTQKFPKGNYVLSATYYGEHTTTIVDEMLITVEASIATQPAVVHTDQLVDHTQLKNLNLANQHPIECIIDLAPELISINQRLGQHDFHFEENDNRIDALEAHSATTDTALTGVNATLGIHRSELDEHTRRINEFVASDGETNAEVVDARTDKDGVTYGSLGARLLVSETKLSTKANQTEVTAALEVKADKSELTVKADKSELTPLQTELDEHEARIAAEEAKSAANAAAFFPDTTQTVFKKHIRLDTNTVVLGGFGVISNTHNSGDFDTILTEGEYGIGGPLTNGPEAGNLYGKLIVKVSDAKTHNNSSNWIWQTFYTTVGYVWFRNKTNNGAWSAWHRLDNKELNTKLNGTKGLGSWTSDSSAGVLHNASIVATGRYGYLFFGYAAAETNPATGRFIVIQGDYTHGVFNNPMVLASRTCTLTAWNEVGTLAISNTLATMRYLVFAYAV